MGGNCRAVFRKVFESKVFVFRQYWRAHCSSCRELRLWVETGSPFVYPQVASTSDLDVVV